MAKITLPTLLSGFKSVAELSQALQDIATEFQNKVLYRNNTSGETNTMENVLDMNSKRIINLISPISDNEPARWIDVKNGVNTVDTVMPGFSGNTKKFLSTDGTVLVFKDTEDLLYNQGGVNAANRDVADKFRESISLRDFGAIGDGVANDRQAILDAITAATSGSLITGDAGDTYLVGSTLTVGKKLFFNLQGATLKAAALANVRFNCSENVFFFSGTYDNVGLTWTGATVTSGGVNKGNFINQTFSPTEAILNADGVTIDDNDFTGQSRGAGGSSFFPCFQITTGASNWKFINNRVNNVVQGVTSDGISALSDFGLVENNKFEDMQFYALKVDVGNHTTFKRNFVKNCRYGVFYEAIDTASAEVTRLSGQGLVINHNIFIDVDLTPTQSPGGTATGCLYVAAADNPFVRPVFRDNFMNNCEVGVRRFCGHMLISGNHFYNGAALVMPNMTVGDVIKCGDLKIINNTIDVGRVPAAGIATIDLDAEDLIGAIILTNQLQDGGSNWTPTILIEGNTIIDYHTNAIQMPRMVATNNPNIKILNNTFETGANSVNHIKISIANKITITGNDELGSAPSGAEVLFVTLSELASTIRYEDNEWQRVTSAPSVDAHKQGEIWTRSNPTLGSVQEWRCIADGTPGTFEGLNSATPNSKTAAADDTTPDVAGVRILKIPANTGATAITALNNANADQIVTLVATSATNPPTIADSGDFNLSAAWAPGVNDTLTLFALTAVSWLEIARSDN